MHSVTEPRLLPLWRRSASGLAALCKTIRGRILVAFLVMSLITAGLGYYATLGVKDAGLLVDKTYDQSLMAINYARAAAADFAAMRAAFARRWIESDQANRAKLDQTIRTLAKTLSDDLDIAVERSQSERAKQAAGNVQRAANAWKSMSEHLLDQTKLDANWETLDTYAAKVDEQIDLLINYTAGDGFLYRQSARAAVARDINLNVGGTLLALLLSGLVAWALTGRIIKPVAAASSVAEHIAGGKLDVAIPEGSADELGDLLASMRVMRDNIKAMMDREVAQRRTAQARLADALESSQEGVVVVDAADQIALANAQAASFLGVPTELLKAGTPLNGLLPALPHSAGAARIVRRQSNGEPEEVRLADGRWLRVSQSATRDGGFIVVCSDISQLKEQKARLHETNLRLDAALDNMSQGLCLFDAQNRLQVVNRRFYEIFGLSRDLIASGVDIQKILDWSKRRNSASKAPAQMLAEQAEFMKRRENGTHYYELDDGRIIASVCSPTSNGGWVATFEDVTERRQAEAKIMHMARHDALTDLPNRVLFREKMEQALARGEDLAVLFLDLDRFKTVNDSLGHPIGDALLCAVTERLQKAVRGADTVARLGGDEFAIVQMGAGPSQASELAGRIIEAVAEPFDISGHQVVIGVSVGIAVAPADGEQPDQLLRNADMALYRAKSEGRGTYHFFQADMDAQMQARHVLEIDLRKALVAGEFELYYQPIVDLGTGRIASFEALIRWNHPSRGVVAPTEFVSIAEEIGLIVPLGDWVLRQACRDAASWPGRLPVAVNLSAAQFRNPTLALSVVSALGASGLAADRLELEITETVLLQDDRAVLDALHQIRELGVRISMDDFGTGYSSLSYLRSFPFDKIKIDRSFIQELGNKDDCAAIVRAVARLGSNLGMVTIAEGIETDEQLEIARMEGCTHGQGYLFSEPRPIAQVPALLQTLHRRVRAA
ncbi:MAG TPA: EAL domain-containing protein [Pseudolabrys sp.]|nr:EAL domain-containing protein [Pseudolabrys sp.]